jgi:hypothetical protein
MYTGFESLPSACELPIIVVMKIKFRIGPIGGTIRATSRPVNNRGGEQARPDDSTSLWSLRRFGATGAPQTENPVDYSLRLGAGACALFASRMSSRGCARFSVAGQRPSLPVTCSAPAVLPWLRFLPQPAGQQIAPATKPPSKTVQFFRISTRFWAESRSYRKQTTKPCLPGSRIAQCDPLFCPLFASANPSVEVRPCVAG